MHPRIRIKLQRARKRLLENLKQVMARRAEEIAAAAAAAE